MRPALRTSPPRPKPCEAGFPASAKSERDEAPLSVGAATADSIKVFRAPGRIVPRLHAEGEAHQARSAAVLIVSRSASRRAMAVNFAVSVQPAG